MTSLRDVPQFLSVSPEKMTLANVLSEYCARVRELSDHQDALLREIVDSQVNASAAFARTKYLNESIPFLKSRLESLEHYINQHVADLAAIPVRVEFGS